MTAHKYACGQQVHFTDRRILGPGPASAFMIVRLLPSGDEVPRYEVQGSRETFTRVAEEIILQAAPACTSPEIRTSA